ncbi:predicted protein [Phaeodactylum tricornutum CCAP 1055/1]|uniref:Uncharacterized protein n=2 Tax=Phaeodactylum tricornutum TaxID=2850 RepID=B5Y5S4_PHATC|nr:predicted protein [Phaeodactylum tricornutum CCAP 1055/1]ACI65708.1 predicted protein [Phaeodactylum tricornutum CCAP 1055/1]|eukprot:XP_002186238.1 predicted protein [Phaeodactylum tricornutum CCAP 1055/1]
MALGSSPSMAGVTSSSMSSWSLSMGLRRQEKDFRVCCLEQGRLDHSTSIYLCLDVGWWNVRSEGNEDDVHSGSVYVNLSVAIVVWVPFTFTGSIAGNVEMAVSEILQRFRVDGYLRIPQKDLCS